MAPRPGRSTWTPRVSNAPPRIPASSQSGGRGGGPTKPGRPTWQWWPHQLTFSLITLLKFCYLYLSYLVEIKITLFSKHAIEKQSLSVENKYEITTDIPGQRRAPCFRSIEQDLSVGFHSVDASVGPGDGDRAGISFSRHSFLECSACLVGSSFCSAFLADLPLLYLRRDLPRGFSSGFVSFGCMLVL